MKNKLNKLIKGVVAVVFAGFIGLLVLDIRSDQPTKQSPELSHYLQELDTVVLALPPNTDPAITLQLIQVRQLKRIADSLEKMERREARRESEGK